MTQFHNVGSATEKNVISIVEDNLKSFIDWSFVNIGGFVWHFYFLRNPGSTDGVTFPP